MICLPSSSILRLFRATHHQQRAGTDYVVAKAKSRGKRFVNTECPTSIVDYRLAPEKRQDRQEDQDQEQEQVRHSLPGLGQA